MIYGKEFVKEFTERTLQNIKVIDNIKAGHFNNLADEHFKVFEDTHFVNSCLGLLVFPREGCLKNIPEKLDLTSEGWPRYFADEGFQSPPNIRQLIRQLRNGIAHCNLQFGSDKNKNIESIRIWNKCRDCKTTTWQVTWSLPDFRKFVKKFSDILMNEDYCIQCSSSSECSKKSPI